MLMLGARTQYLKGCENMYEYLICKYDPQYRVNGIYTRNEWTGDGDIGKTFVDGILTREEYEDTLNRYVQCAMDILKRDRIVRMTVSDIETYFVNVVWKEGEVVEQDQLPVIISDCLHDKYWCRLSGEESFVHFGYDLYMYIGCNIALDKIKAICAQYNMFAIERESPHKQLP